MVYYYSILDCGILKEDSGDVVSGDIGDDDDHGCDRGDDDDDDVGGDCGDEG